MLPKAFAGLRVRLLVLVFVALLPALALILATAFEQRRLAADAAKEGALRLTRLGALEQSRVLDGARQLLASLARSPEILNRNKAACSARLSEILKQFPIYTNLSAMTPKGDVFCSGTPLSAPLNVWDRSYFQRALKTRDVALGEYVFGSVTGRPNLRIALPAIDNGSVRAIVTAGLGLDWLARFVEEARLPKDSTATVLNQRGVILARYPDAGAWIGKVATGQPLFQTIMATRSEATIEAVGLDGVPRLYAFTRLVTGPEPGDAYLVIGIPSAIAYAKASRALSRNLLALGVASVLAFAAAWIASDRLVLRKVRTLASTIRRLEAGDLSARAGQASGLSELDELAGAFDTMAARLEANVVQLRESEAKFRALVEQSLVGVYVAAGDKIIYFNPAGAGIFGYRADEIGRLRPIDLVHPDDRALVTENLRARLHGEVDAIRYTFRGLRKDGTTIDCEAFGCGISFEGQPAVLGTVLDITERTQTLELRAMNERLQQEISERRRAEDEADRANRAKSEFLSRMSHELRTPLNGILGFGQLLQREALSPDQRESVEHILKGGRHLLTLINEVLDIARIEAGKLSMSLEPVVVGEVLQSALDLVRPQATARSVKLPTRFTSDHCVIADRQRLQQVLLNLLSNAVKYNRNGGSVAVSCDTSGPGQVRIVVTDTGRGIAPAMLERLYTPFDRLGADQEGVEGTGLGLTLSRRLVEAMNGVITVESEPGTGTTVTIEFPAAERPGSNCATSLEKSVDAELPRTHGTVLYIEDNLANLRLIERIVGLRPGLTLLSAMQGSRGLELARDHGPRVIVLDLHLPDLPGGEVLTRLRQDPRTRDIPVVMLSADATPTQVTRLLAQGARAYLTKPLDVTQFLTLLDELLVEKGG